MTIANPDMPASRLFDEIYTRWLAQFERWKRTPLPPDELHNQALVYASQVVEEYNRRLTRELGSPFQQQIDASVYALVALIDESVLYGDWPALSLWHSCPLEYHLWQTHSAGDQIPARSPLCSMNVTQKAGFSRAVFALPDAGVWFPTWRF